MRRFRIRRLVYSARLSKLAPCQSRYRFRIPGRGYSAQLSKLAPLSICQDTRIPGREYSPRPSRLARLPTDRRIPDPMPRIVAASVEIGAPAYRGGKSGVQVTLIAAAVKIGAHGNRDIYPGFSPSKIRRECHIWRACPSGNRSRAPRLR